ncbi:MAG: YcjF family protein [Bosea sp. (in: a-proteobacteria)]
MAAQKHDKPTAIILDEDDAPPSKRKAIVLIPETDEPDAAPVTPPAVPSKRFGWGKMFVLGLGGFLSLALWLWIEATARQMLAQSPMMGFAAVAFLVLAMLALGVMLARLAYDLARLNKVVVLREQSSAALAANDVEAARAVSRQIVALTSKQPETAAGRAALAAAEPGLVAAADVLALTEREILAPLDARAAELIANAAKQVSLVTAVSPRALVDVLFVAFACTRLLRAIAATYGARPGWIGLMRLGRQTLVHLAVTGGIAAGETILQQIMGQGLAARLSAKLGEGVLNGLLTARVGLSAIAQCRPMPFVEQPQPTLKDVAGEFLPGRSDQA